MIRLPNHLVRKQQIARNTKQLQFFGDLQDNSEKNYIKSPSRSVRKQSGSERFGMSKPAKLTNFLPAVREFLEN